jgi:ABC-2 type transport system permease protein
VADRLLDLRSDLRVFRRLAGARVRGELQYRTSFAAFTLAQAAITFLDCAVILIFFDSVPAIGGWDRGQVLYLYATATLSLGVADFLMGSVEYLPEVVRTGVFDRFLVRPSGVLCQLLAQEFALRRIGRILQAGIVLVVVLVTMDAEWTPARLLVALAGIVGSAIAFCSLFLATSSLSFWSPNTQEFANAFTYGGATVAEFPTHVFPAWLRAFFIGVVPAGVVVYLPAMYALGADNPLHIARWVQILSPAACIPVALVAGWIWRRGIRRYESTGS